MNIAYRWFPEYRISEPILHFATASYNFRNRFAGETIEEIFQWLLGEINGHGYLSSEIVFVDGSHIKANANIHKSIKKAIPEAAKIYEEQLCEEINVDRKAHGKKPFDDDPKDKPPKEKEITVSTTDPESGVFHKGEHKRCFAYTVRTACDKRNYIMGVTVNPGNMHDSVAFEGLYHQLIWQFANIKVLTPDAGYKTPWICKQFLDDGRIPSMPYTRPKTKKRNHAAHEYVYDEYYDCIICPECRILNYSTAKRWI